MSANRLDIFALGLLLFKGGEQLLESFKFEFNHHRESMAGEKQFYIQLVLAGNSAMLDYQANDNMALTSHRRKHENYRYEKRPSPTLFSYDLAMERAHLKFTEHLS
ncbi:hypothetical protein OUZ56_013808 [Daphnia magna]|uniref:Uncharacterized protein n=1 Tax=Daphnia magna TaxID=35525 RepID=A0ABQ9Z707_9CRUS|nr:hypothetical protein OUZ56_013808 [Daphnia magna]